MERKILVLSLALAGLLGLGAALRPGSRAAAPRPLLAGVDEAGIKRLQIDRPGESITLEKRDGAWRMTAPVADLADPNPIGDLLAALLQAELSSEVAHDPSSYPSYAVDEAHAVRLRVAGAQPAPLLDAFFGSEALGEDSTHVRLDGNVPVYVARGLGARGLGRGAKDYRERRLSAVAGEGVQKLTVTAGRRRYELSKSSPAWAAAMSLQASDFADGAVTDQESGLNAPRLAVELAGAAPASFAIGGPASNPALLYARASGRPALLLVPAAEVEALLKSLGGGR